MAPARTSQEAACDTLRTHLPSHTSNRASLEYALSIMLAASAHLWDPLHSVLLGWAVFYSHCFWHDEEFRTLQGGGVVHRHRADACRSAGWGDKSRKRPRARWRGERVSWRVAGAEVDA